MRGEPLKQQEEVGIAHLDLAKYAKAPVSNDRLPILGQADSYIEIQVKIDNNGPVPPSTPSLSKNSSLSESTM